MSDGFREQIVQLRAEGLTYKQIAAQVGCSKATVSNYCSKEATQSVTVRNNIEKRIKKAQIPQNKKELLYWLLEHRVRRTDIADALALEYVEVRRFEKEQGLEKKEVELSNYELVKRRRRHLKMLAVARLGGRCQKCKYNRSMQALAFHHPDPCEKEFSISNYATRSWARIRVEVDKCVLLCANCHCEVHEMSAEENPG